LNIHLTPADAPAVFSDIHLGLTARFKVETIGFLSQQIQSIEKAVLPQVSLRPEFEMLLTRQAGDLQLLGFYSYLRENQKREVHGAAQNDPKEADGKAQRSSSRAQAPDARTGSNSGGVFTIGGLRPHSLLRSSYEWALHQCLSQGSLSDVDEGSEAP
jgi:hypothetical protein